MDARVFYRTALLSFAYSLGDDGVDAATLARYRPKIEQLGRDAKIDGGAVPDESEIDRLLSELAREYLLFESSPGRYTVTDRARVMFERAPAPKRLIRQGLQVIGVDADLARSIVAESSGSAHGDTRGVDTTRLTIAGGDSGSADGDTVFDTDLPQADEPGPAPSPPPADTPGEAPLTAYARIEMAADVQVGIETSLVVGIAALPQSNVSGDALQIKATFPFELRITVMAEGFALRVGERWSSAVGVTALPPYPAIELHVTPLAEGPERRIIAVFYSVNDETLGYAGLPVTVHQAGASAPASGPATPASVVVSTINTPYKPDLTIQIAEFEDGSGRLSWSFVSPHIDIADEPIAKTIGNAPDQFAAGLIRQINVAKPTLAAVTLNGIAAQINDAMPAKFKDVWRRLHDAIKPPRTPTVLILSAEPYVPWELTAAEPLFDPDAPAILGAQADVGRWILNADAELPLPPPFELAMKPMAEVTAVYTDASTPRLPEAEAEGKALRADYCATHVDATGEAITACFHQASPDAKLLHIALHGVYNAQSPVDGLIMVDNYVLTAAAIRGGKAKRTPFVFLNACQVGSGKEVLGQYAGLPAAFVYANARGVIAPLWSIDDTIAKDIALRFYEGLAKHQTPASLLRAERKRFASSAAPSPTYLAYVFFGNPSSVVPEPASVPGG